MTDFRVEVAVDANALPSGGSDFFLPAGLVELNSAGDPISIASYARLNVGDSVRFMIFDVSTLASTTVSVSSFSLAFDKGRTQIPTSPLAAFTRTQVVTKSPTQSLLFSRSSELFPTWEVSFIPTGFSLEVFNPGFFKATKSLEATVSNDPNPRTYRHDPEWIIGN